MKSNVLDLGALDKVKKTVNIIQIRDFVLGLFVVIVFTAPRTLQGIKIGLLFILLIFFFINNRYRTSYFRISFIYPLLFIVPFIVAVFNGNQPGYILNVIRISIFFPLILLLILQQFNLQELRRIFEKGILISIILVLLIFLSSLLNAFGLFPYNINQFFYPEESFVGIHEGYLHVVNSSLSYLIFVVPLFFFGDKFSLKNYKIYLFLIMLFVAIVSGRRILLLPFGLVILFNVKKIIIPMLLLLLLTFLIVNKEVYADLELETIVNRFKDAVEDNGDSQVRGDQSRYFYRYIEERPIIGYGLGSYMPDFIRSDEMRFAYEKTWDYMLFSMGIPTALLHLLCYGTLMLLVLKNNLLKKVTEIRFRNGLVVAIVSILIASSTNPYWLSNFDYCLPLALLMRFSQQDQIGIT